MQLDIPNLNITKYSPAKFKSIFFQRLNVPLKKYKQTWGAL